MLKQFQENKRKEVKVMTQNEKLEALILSQTNPFDANTILMGLGKDRPKKIKPIKDVIAGMFSAGKLTRELSGYIECENPGPTTPRFYLYEVADPYRCPEVQVGCSDDEHVSCPCCGRRFCFLHSAGYAKNHQSSDYICGGCAAFGVASSPWCKDLNFGTTGNAA